MIDRRTRLILRGRHSAQWYDNTEPHWTEGKKKRPCMTAEQAAELRKKIIKLLKRHERKEGANRVRKRLEGCKPERRCLSGACPECTRAYQRWFVAELNELLKAENRQFYVVSIVPQTNTPEGKLS